MQQKAISRAFKALGTLNSIYVPASTDREAVDTAVKRVMDIDDSMSVFKPGSDIARINANAGVGFVQVGEDTMKLLKRSVYFSEISEGVFDITAAPLIRLWGIGKKQWYIPGADEIENAKKLVGYRDLILDEANCRAMLARRGQGIDLGGIAKGYAADEVRWILRERGIQYAIINLGGNVWAMGKRQGIQPWRIGVQDPLEPTGYVLGELHMEDEAAVTSGSYERFFIADGVRYHHILDPRTGRPVDAGLLGVTVTGSCSMDLDALTTAVFVLGPDKGALLVQKMKAQAVFVGTDGGVYVTKGLQPKFRLITETDRNKRVVS